MPPVRIAQYRSEHGAARVGAVRGTHIYDVATLLSDPSLASIGNLMRSWDTAVEQITQELPDGTHQGKPVSEVQLLAPIRHGATIFGAGANYYGHSREMAQLAGRPLPPDPKLSGQQPWHFLKAPSTVVGSNATVRLPSLAPDTLDWEVELAAVIGTPARNVSVADALSHVAAYTVANDLSARGMLWRDGMHDASPFRADWVLHKNFDGSTPLGPWLVPAAEIGDPQHLQLGLRINGTPMQEDSTSDMIFSVAEQIAHLSRVVTLTPGDVILTGTPGGNAAFHGRFLQAGDEVEAWVEHIGSLHTQIGAAI